MKLSILIALLASSATATHNLEEHERGNLDKFIMWAITTESISESHQNATQATVLHPSTTKAQESEENIMTTTMEPATAPDDHATVIEGVEVGTPEYDLLNQGADNEGNRPVVIIRQPALGSIGGLIAEVLGLAQQAIRVVGVNLFGAPAAPSTIGLIIRNQTTHRAQSGESLKSNSSAELIATLIVCCRNDSNSSMVVNVVP